MEIMRIDRAEKSRYETVSSALLARVGALDVRLATNHAERLAAQRLRYEVFCRETGTDVSGTEHETHLDRDRYDADCAHIVVIDTAAHGVGGRPVVAGTCRVFGGPGTRAASYTATEFATESLFARHSHLGFCEVGRACVAPAYRDRRTLHALWQGLFAYAGRHGIDVFFGAASFPGIDPHAHAMALSYLHHAVGAPPDWRVEARSPGAVPMDLLPAGAVEPRAALRAMPALVRGYVQVGAHVGSTAFVDRRFQTIDVLILVRLAAAPAFWRRRFEKAAIGHAIGPDTLLES